MNYLQAHFCAAFAHSVPANITYRYGIALNKAANDLVQNTGTRNIKRIARSCSLDILKHLASKMCWVFFHSTLISH